MAEEENMSLSFFEKKQLRRVWHKRDATDAGTTAGKARRVIEEDIGQSAISSENYLHLKKVEGQGKQSGGTLLGTPSAEHVQRQQGKGVKRQEQGQQPSLFDEREIEES